MRRHAAKVPEQSESNSIGQVSSLCVVFDAHRRVLHSAVQETLNEVCMTYWIVRGWRFVQSVIWPLHDMSQIWWISILMEITSCFTWILWVWVSLSRPFQFTRVDFAGHLYVMLSFVIEKSKVQLCLFTCCTTWAVQLELVTDLGVTTFVQCFKWFSGRRGNPSKMVHDNGMTGLLRLLLRFTTMKVCRNTSLIDDWGRCLTLRELLGGESSLNIWWNRQKDAWIGQSTLT